MQHTIDLRSDTVTRPSQAMRAAMAGAAVGDDVLDDDPSVHLLQDTAAALLGKEAALFMPSGTMSNAVAIKVQTVPGDEILLDSNAHSMLYEAGNPATIAQVLTRQFHSMGGVPNPPEVADLIREESLHSPGTSLVLLENTHNRAGGAVIPISVLDAIFSLTRARAVRVHVDGARIFNAATALGVPVSEIAASADTVTFCLSKGLGCPVGSVLCGERSVIDRARRVRKMLGGGMRQAGVVAAAGVFALEHNIDRLADDHANARLLATALVGAPGLEVECPVPQTNMVYARTAARADAVCARLKSAFGVLISSMGPYTVRAVTHLDVGADDVRQAAEAIRLVCAEQASA